MKLLAGKTAIVTGGGRSIGKAIAAAFAGHGANVAIIDRDVEAAESAAAEIQAATGANILPLQANVGDEEQVLASVNAVAATFGDIHILVNNAGICYLANQEGLLVVSDEQWDRTFQVNVKGSLYYARAVRPYMQRAGYGRIINFSSQAGRNGGQRVSPEYSASKAAIICLTKTLALEMGKDGITVNTVAPGLIKSDMTKHMLINDGMVPLGRIGDPEDVADAVVFLASNLARYVTGVCLDVNGGTVMA
ncbi:MAG: 3-oxoacyl-[acyl-carrier-protein] reductase FabG [Desulfovibrio sp.]